MNLKCYFGFHDYQPVDGLWWKNLVIDCDGIFAPDVRGIYVIKLFECSECSKIYEKIIETFAENRFNLNVVKNSLIKSGINHVSAYYAYK